MKKVLFALVAMSLLFTACEDGNDDFIKLKEVDDVCTMMDDINFMAYCYEEFDVNKDGKVSVSEAAAVSIIDGYDGFNSIKGIEYFTNIERLSSKANKRGLRAHDINLSNHKKLREVRLSFAASEFRNSPTKISINFGNNTVLENLYLDGCNLNDMDLSECVNLTEVKIHDVAIENLNLANGNEIDLFLKGWDNARKDIPALTIWLKQGQILNIENTCYNWFDLYNYTIKYVD